MHHDVYRPRWIRRSLAGPASRGKVRLILGARQTGKTWLLKNVSGARALMIGLQDPRERLRYERAPGTLIAEIEARREKRLVVAIDEIQKAPALLDEVQLLHDRHPGRYDFFLTGSSARRLRAGAANLLPGRAHAYRLYPVIEAERADSGESAVLPMAAMAEQEERFPRSSIDDLLVWGSLPGVASEPTSRRSATLETYAEVYLEEEIRREALVRDVGAFARFLELAALESGQMMNLTKLSQEAGVPLATVRTYYQVLVDTFVGYWIPAFGGSSRKRILTTPRFVFFDTGVRNAAARLPLGRNLLKTQAGPLLEQWVVAELFHRASYLGRAYRISFWRTRHGAEVDAVVETPREVIPVEVKWTDRPRPTDARHVELFLDAHPGRARRGYVVCRCPRPLTLSRRVTAVPWQML